MRVLIDAQAYAEQRTRKRGDSDVSSPPPHDEWVKLAEERERLAQIRGEIESFVRKNKLSGNMVEGLDKLETMLNISKGVRTGPLIMETVSEDEEIDEKPLPPDTNIKPSAAKKKKWGFGKKKHKKKGKDKKEETEQKDVEAPVGGGSDSESASKSEFVEVPQHEVDIRGHYFDDQDQLNEIAQDFKVKLANSQCAIAMEPDGSSDDAVLALSVDLVKTKQEALCDDALVEALMVQDQDDNQKIIKCKFDEEQEELVWESGHIWFKKDWNILVGAWTDPDNNLIEIRQDNTLRYINGYGPFEGEFIGYKKLHVKMPNGEFMSGHLLDDKDIKWENDEMWHRCTDQGCLIM